MKTTPYSRFLRDCLALIERTGSGPNRSAMRRELAEWALGNDDVDVFRRLRQVERAFEFAYAKTRRGGHRDRIACALHAIARHAMSISRATKLALATAGDLDAVKATAKAAGIDWTLLAATAPDRIRAAVLREVENLSVVLDPRAVEDMLLPAIECLSVRRPDVGGRYTETYGLCFGSRRDQSPVGGMTSTVYHVSRVVTQLRALATAASVSPNAESERVHMELAERLFGHLDLIGDYHSHPYATVAKMKRWRGWEPSNDDKEHFHEWAASKHVGDRRPRFFLIAAMARGKRTRSRAKRAVRRNRLEFVVADVHLVISAWRVDLDGSVHKNIQLRVAGITE